VYKKYDRSTGQIIILHMVLYTCVTLNKICYRFDLLNSTYSCFLLYTGMHKLYFKRRNKVYVFISQTFPARIIKLNSIASRVVKDATQVQNCKLAMYSDLLYAEQEIQVKRFSL